MAEPIRVVIVDDHAMFRAGVRAELGAARVDVRRPRPRTSTRRSPRSPSTGPTWCCSTCTCPAAAGSR